MVDILFYSFVIVLGLLGIVWTYLSNADKKIKKMKSSFEEIEKKLEKSKVNQKRKRSYQKKIKKTKKKK